MLEDCPIYQRFLTLFGTRRGSHDGQARAGGINDARDSWRDDRLPAKWRRSWSLVACRRWPTRRCLAPVADAFLRSTLQEYHLWCARSGRHEIEDRTTVGNLW